MLRALLQLRPIILLFSVIIGTIYKGWATPTEAAAVGVGGAIAAAFAGVNRQMFAKSVIGTVKLTSMIMLVVIGTSFPNFTLASAGIGQELRAFLEGLGLSPLMTIFVVVCIYIVLGFFIETLSLMAGTIPIMLRFLPDACGCFKQATFYHQLEAQHLHERVVGNRAQAEYPI